MRNTAYMTDLERNIAKYDNEIRGMKAQYRTLFEEIREVDAAIAVNSKLSRRAD